MTRKDVYVEAVKTQQSMIRDMMMEMIDSSITNRIELTKVCHINVDSDFYGEMSKDIKTILINAVDDYFKA